MPVADQRPINAAMAAEMSRYGHTGKEFAIYVSDPPGLEVVPAAVMLSEENLVAYCRRSLTGWSDAPESENLHATVSWMMRFYVSCVVGAAVVPLTKGVGFDLSIPRTSFVIVDDFPMGLVIDPTGSVVRCAERPTDWPVLGDELASVEELRRHVIRSLFQNHLVPAFSRVTGIVPLAMSVLWGHVVEMIDLFCEDGYDQHDPSEVSILQADREVFLFSESLPGLEGRNPLLGLMDWEDVDDPRYSRPQQVRKACCINFLIEGRNRDGLNLDSYCRSCARITREQRLEMWKIFADEQGW